MHSVHPTPKFSVITVTYNAEKVLEDTIQSVIAQTYHCLLYTSPSPRDRQKSRMPSSA